MKTITKAQIKEILDFRDRRLNLQLTLRQASEGSGISNPLISQIEHNTKNPGFHTVIALHNYYRKLELKTPGKGKNLARKPKGIKKFVKLSKTKK